MVIGISYPSVDESDRDRELSDDESTDDDVDDDSAVQEILSREPTLQCYEEQCIMVYNLPLVGPDKLPKLRTVLNPLFSIRNNYKYKDHHPVDKEGSTKGYCFVEYESKDAAYAGLHSCDQYKLDKNYTFSAYPLSEMIEFDSNTAEFKKRHIAEPEQNWKAPQKMKCPKVNELWSWLENTKCMDQYGIQYEIPVRGSTGGTQPRVEVYWFERNSEPTPAEEAARDNWTENIFKWSPFGSYITTLHKAGVALWTGHKFDRFNRFIHEGANFVEFSPNEKFIITYARDERRPTDQDNCLCIFDVFTGEKRKSFSPAGRGVRIPEWPFIKWSFDEKYFAFCRPRGNSICIYDTDTFAPNGKPIELDGLLRFEFNPAKNLIAFYCEERLAADTPAEIGIIEFPSRTKVRVQRTFNASMANLYWQKSGDYLAAHTERYSSRKTVKDPEKGTNEIKLSGVSSHLEIFDCTKKDVSVQTLSLNDPFINFGWEPKGNKFCVLVGAGSKVTPLIYCIDPGKPTPLLMSKLESGIQLNSVEWAPQGGWLAVFASNSPSGHLFFIDTNGNEATRFRMVEHAPLNQGSWDPTGRYFAACTFTRTRYESSYRIFTFQGRELLKRTQDSLVRFKWRPRPPVQLSEQLQKEIRKSMRQISAKFDEEDRSEQVKMSKELLEKRKKMVDDFNKFQMLNSTAFEEEFEERLKLRGGRNMEAFLKDLIEIEETIPLSTLMERIDEQSPAVSVSDIAPVVTINGNL